ncbi:hypothetical protein AOC36_08420 [Erysipelothrix larvae]|uniref:O-antigen ligase-related domain-containing protein n=1 Tax=Erysipelothrix larvae TaxID=1514105 RepID=A0A0X8H114_9FIRM|nr:O-antigen ligase family protein [Erysipelothrix larvae]AMC94009.1 hypothetical protein AOC36_08420 [Erysipelothrix larvae]
MNYFMNIDWKTNIGKLRAALFENTIFLSLAMLTFLQPATELLGEFDIVFDLMKVACLLLILPCYIFYNKKSVVSYVIIFMQFVFLTSTILNQGRVWWSLVQFASIVLLVMLFDVGLKYNHFLKRIFPISLSMLLLCVLSMFVFFPEGMYVVDYSQTPSVAGSIVTDNYLWGFDNSSIFRVIPVLMLVGVYLYRQNKEWHFISLVFITASAFGYVRSFAAFFSLVFLFFALILYKKFPNLIRKYFTFRNSFLLVLAIFIFLSFGRSNFIMYYIAEQLDKVGSMFYRFTVWQLSIDYVLTNNPILGVGFANQSIDIARTLMDHPHNIFIDVLYRGGLIASASYMYILWLTHKYTTNKTNTDTILATIFFFTFLLASQFDYYNNEYLHFSFYICFSYFGGFYKSSRINT